MKIQSKHELILGIPKAELHVHIEGTLEPELLFEIAARNAVKLKYDSVEDLRKAYHFNNLQEFLDIYYAGADVLLFEQDFFDLTMAYLRRMRSEQVVHAEIFFDPQTHTARGVSFETVITGIRRAVEEARQEWGMSVTIIMCFLRHLSEESAQQTLDQALPYKQYIPAVGLDSSERGHPPAKFERVFARALEEGFITVAHAGEEGPAAYVRDALDLLHISRIDHGIRSLEDPALVSELAERQIALTLCPLSNQKLQVIPDLRNYPLRKMLENGMLVMINSDDPAYFGGYVVDNFLALDEALDLTPHEIHLLARNSFVASFLSEKEQSDYLNRVDHFYRNWLCS